MAMRALSPRAAATSLSALELGFRFHIEGEDPGIERESHLGLGLADAGECDLLGRNAHGERAAKLTLGHDVHSGARARERGQHAERLSWP